MSGICVWFPDLLIAGALKGTDGGGSTTRQIEGQRQLDVQVVNIFPPHAPSLLDLFTLEWSLKAEETLGGRRESLTSSFHTNLNPVVSQDLLCGLLTWPLPPSGWKLTQHFWTVEFLSPALILWEFWISLLLFLRSNLKFPTTPKWYYLSKLDK